MIINGKPSRARVLSVIAATTISLACGTNYVYSAWAPQFAQKLKLSATESNLIGTLGNLGMYSTGIPLGMMVDRFGPRSGVALGVVLFALGYYPLAKAFDAGPGVVGIPVLCIFSFFTGMGSNSAFLAAIKVAALNFPESRGSATAFPLAAFGLSAFFFATLALAFPHDTPHFLLLLATGTVVLPLVSFPFIRVMPQQSYNSAPQHDSHPLHRRKSAEESRHVIGHPDTGAQIHISQPFPISVSSEVESASQGSQRLLNEENDESDEVASLLSDTSSTEMANFEVWKSIESDQKAETPRIDIRGFALVVHTEFWLLFCILGLLTGTGLMTINNIGNDATALWKHYDPSTDSVFIAKRQVMHVSILSVCSFAGRLLSGIGSDILVNKYNQSRFWCLLASGSGFCLAQLIAVMIEQPAFLVLVSGITGISYGLLFGVYPSIMAHTFGVHGLSQNWGTICLAPVIGGNIFNLLYGTIYDSHSIIENGDRQCIEGKSCYQAAYLVTFFAAVMGIMLCLWSIRHEHKAHAKDEKGRRRPVHERIA